MIEKLKSHLNSISTEQFEKEIDAIEAEGYTSGPTMEEFINNQQDLNPEYGKIIEDNFWELTDNKEDYSPYCPICDACGEEGCCAPTACKQHPDGSYCEAYLKDLKFGYMMNRFFENEIAEHLPEELKAKYSTKWEEVYDEIYK